MISPSGWTNRSRIDIIADILKVALSDTRKTRIMWKANLSHKVVDEYLDFLTKTGLIHARAEGGRGTVYRTTRKGEVFLSNFRAMKSLLAEQPIPA